MLLLEDQRPVKRFLRLNKHELSALHNLSKVVDGDPVPPPPPRTAAQIFLVRQAGLKLLRAAEDIARDGIDRDDKLDIADWVEEFSPEPFGFRWCCDVMDMQPGKLQRAYQDLLTLHGIRPFALGEWVEWQRQGQPRVEGEVWAKIPAGVVPHEVLDLSRFEIQVESKTPRVHVSWLIKRCPRPKGRKERIYWPTTNLLRPKEPCNLQ